MRRAHLLAFALAWLGAASPAAAQHEMPRTLFEQGLDAADRGDDAAAERAFRASLELRWSVSAAYNLAELLSRHDGADEALSLLDRVAADTEAPLELRERARERAAELRAAGSGSGAGSGAGSGSEPGSASGPGFDEPALALSLGVGLGATGVLAGFATAYWIRANEDYADLEIACADTPCSEDDERIRWAREQVDFTNFFLAASLVAGAVTVTAVIVVLATGGESDASARLRITPFGASVEGAF